MILVGLILIIIESRTKQDDCHLFVISTISTYSLLFSVSNLQSNYILPHTVKVGLSRVSSWNLNYKGCDDTAQWKCFKSSVERQESPLGRRTKRHRRLEYNLGKRVFGGNSSELQNFLPKVAFLAISLERSSCGPGLFVHFLHWQWLWAFPGLSVPIPSPHQKKGHWCVSSDVRPGVKDLPKKKEKEEEKEEEEVFICPNSPKFRENWG